MSKKRVSSKDRIDFISFMKGFASSRPDLTSRIDLCMDNVSIVVSSETSDIKSEKVLHHSPKRMIEFLRLFSIDDHYKWYTHKWDQSGVSLEHLIKTQSDKRQQLSDFVYNTENPINNKTYNQVWNFINFNNIGDKIYPWYDNEGIANRIGWHSVVEPHSRNLDTPIENLKFSDGSLFLDYIRKFKGSIEFRTDLRMDDRFHKVIRNSIKRYVNGAVQVEYTEEFRMIGYDVNIYCDVAGVTSALKILCDWIVKHKVNGSNVIVDLSADNDGYELKILHSGSYLTNIGKIQSPSGDFANLRNRLFSVCDFTIFGDYKELGEDKGSIIVYGLNSETIMSGDFLNDCKIEHKDNHVGGVMYNIKLYKG